MCRCGPDCLALVDSNEWGSCVKVISVDTGQVLTTWGRQLDNWTPRAVTVTADGHLVVSNVHPEASSRLALFTVDGKQVRFIRFHCMHIIEVSISGFLAIFVQIKTVGRIEIKPVARPEVLQWGGSGAPCGVQGTAPGRGEGRWIPRR